MPEKIPQIMSAMTRGVLPAEYLFVHPLLNDGGQYLEAVIGEGSYLPGKLGGDIIQGCG